MGSINAEQQELFNDMRDMLLSTEAWNNAIKCGTSNLPDGPYTRLTWQEIKLLGDRCL